MAIRQLTVRGREYLKLGTRLLQRYRQETPTGGIWDAADLNWWWRRKRSTDDLGQLFWMEGDEPIAGVLQTDWGTEWQCDPISLPSQGLDLRQEVWEQALEATSSAHGLAVSVRTDDFWALDFLAQASLVDGGGGSTTMWMAAEDCPPATTLPTGYRLTDRTETGDRPHHLIKRNEVDVELRLGQTPLYDPELDLLILNDDGEVVGYAMFWNDVVTGIGMVEPMRTEEGHERKGLAGHLLRSGFDRLVERGARRLKIGYESPVAGSVYRRAGFVEDSTVVIFRRI